MAYADPSKARNIILNIRLTEAEDNLLRAVTEYTGQQKSSLVRELVLEQARLVLMGQADIGLSEAGCEDAKTFAFATR